MVASSILAYGYNTNGNVVYMEALLKNAFAHVYVEIDVKKRIVPRFSLGLLEDVAWHEFL